ncbi:MAG: hypothetical protein NC926_03545 [Candidatus Omnitrophica bacterium]|nr:hypothetical protein [Candidatus Omnitrophota bacterium]MCM8807018.1 hypothetical protein [Candidatus Omnitrophota bacterium]
MNKCSICGDKIYIRFKLSNGKKRRLLNFCENCYKKFIFKDKKVKNKKKKCPFCGYTVDDFREYRFLGCSFCYEYFYEDVIKYMKKIHTSIIYKGKFPKEFKNVEKIKNFLNDIKGFLIKSVKLNGKSI